MNWRNPFLITYLAVTVAGAAILGYLVYSSYAHAVEVDDSYTSAVTTLQKLQNRVPFPNAANNEKYVEYTKQYHAEYEKLLAKVASMQKPVEALSPQAFQDRLRSDVSQVQTAAKENGVALPPDFYLGFDQYRGTLPPESAAGPLARELGAIRMIVDQLISLKVKEILGVKRNTLSEESGRPAAAPTPGNTRQRPSGGRPRQQQPQREAGIVNSDTFDISFVAEQNGARTALNFIASAEQFFIIRSLNIQSSAMEGPKKVDDSQQPSSYVPPTEPGGNSGAPHTPTMRLLVGRETLTVTLHIEMITFNNLPTAQK